MHDDCYVILISPFGKQEAKYAGICVNANSLEVFKVMFCDFEKYFILKDIPDDLFSKFLDLRQTFLFLDNSVNTD